MLKWLKRLKAWFRPQPKRYLSGLRNWDDLPVLTKLPVYEQGPYIPSFVSPSDRVPRQTGVIWCWDHSRPLGWREYRYWETRILPPGWGIVEIPDEGAVVPGERAYDAAAAKK